ncbi:MAG: SDR family oxidoreductase [Polyangiaceae bacterium]|nr:SDR family oxidoreductase [Polyangiaceae bacterium]
MNPPRSALVIGGTGYVGREVVRAFAREGIGVVFTYHRHADVARTLEAETGARSFPTNLTNPNEIRELFSRLDEHSLVPDILIHCAVLACRSSIADVTDSYHDELYAVNVRSILVAVQSFVSRLGGRGGDVVLTASQAGITKLPASVPFAATQSARLGMTHALAKELGSADVRVNLVLLGVLDGGITAQIEQAQLEDYQRFSALSRRGTSVEAARAIVRLALTNRWMTGSILPVTGGL